MRRHGGYGKADAEANTVAEMMMKAFEALRGVSTSGHRTIRGSKKNQDTMPG